MCKIEQLYIRDIPDVSAIYYASGKLNAFEEHAVRSLSRHILSGCRPSDLNNYLKNFSETVTSANHFSSRKGDFSHDF